jgi:hypothetical protein
MITEAHRKTGAIVRTGVHVDEMPLMVAMTQEEIRATMRVNMETRQSTLNQHVVGGAHINEGATSVWRKGT